MASFMVYKVDLGDRRYFGCTGLDLQHRCANMKNRPVLWLRGHARLKTLKLLPLLGRRVPWKTALAIEAARTAAAWAQQPDVVRGGPWCLKRLGRVLIGELQQVADAVRAARGPHAEAASVFEVAKRMALNGALQRHLRGECYKCGLHIRSCACRGRQWKDLGLDVAKPRSGKTGHQYRKAKGWAATETVYKVHKWGKKPADAKRRDNRKYPKRKGCRRKQM